MSPDDKARHRAILDGIAAGSYRFAPAVDPEHGAAWPPGWRSAIDTSARPGLHPKVAEALAKGREAVAIAKADAKLKRHGALSKADAGRINGQKSAASMRHRDRMPEMMKARSA